MPLFFCECVLWMLPRTTTTSIATTTLQFDSFFCFLAGHRRHRPKYGITEQRTNYKGVMRLTIRSFSSADVGTYHCVSTNSLGRAEGTLRLYGKTVFGPFL